MSYCEVEGCTNKGKNKGEHRKRDRLCDKHLRLRRLETGTTDSCSLCKWEGPCDKHRIIHGKNGGKYVEGNIVVVCPNCHRLIHRGGIDPKLIVPTTMGIKMRLTMLLQGLDCVVH